MNRLIALLLATAVLSTAGLTAQQTRRLDAVVTEQSVKRIAAERPSQIEMSVPQIDGSATPVQLERIAWTSPWAKCVVVTEQGSDSSPLANDVVMYRTKLSSPGADWTIIAIDKRGSMMGLTQQAGRRAVLVRDASNTLQVHRQTSAKPRECMTSPDKISRAALSALRQAGTKTSESPNANDTLTLELALEVDNDAVRAAGSSADARLLVSLNMAAVTAVYEAELRTRVVVSNMRVWEKSNDPYPTQQDVFSLLDTFREVYMTSMTSVQRDAAVFITSRDAAGGIAATIGGLCEPDGAYCAVDIETEAVAYPTWSWNVSVISHELGHLCGGIHTHSCYWPNGALDSCVAAESGTCFSSDEVKPSRGTIMSYCFSNGDPAFEDVLEFHPMHRLVLRDYLQSGSCVGNQPRPRPCRLAGSVRDAETGKPLSGITLKIRPVVDDAYRATPAPAGDTVVISQADGSWMFTGLARGLYAIDIDGPYTIFPAEVGEDAFSFGVAVADSIERKDILVTKGQLIDITIQNDGDTTPTVLNIFSEKLPGALSLIPVPFPEGTQKSVTVRRVLPLGRAVIVPSATGRRFTPSSLRLDVSGESPQQSVTLVSTSVLPQLTTTIAIAVAEVTRVPIPKLRLARGIPYVITESGSNRRLTGTTDADGVVVIEMASAEAAFDVVTAVDTAITAPASDAGFLLPMYGETACVVLVQPRRMPLIARQYKFRAEAGEYRPLTTPTVLRDAKQFGRVVTPVALPFPISVLDRTFDTMYVHTNGFLSLGGKAFPAWMRGPLTMWNDADMVIAPLAYDMVLDTNAPNGPRICWAVEGATPSRTLVVEWRSMTLLFFDDTQGTYIDVGRFSFQARLHEGGNIEMVYDTEIPVSRAVDVQVGLRGNDVLDHQAVRSAPSSDILQSQALFDPAGLQKVRITPNRQLAKGTTFRWDLAVTGVEETQTSLGIDLFPNPSNGHFILTNAGGGALIRIVSIQGIEVLRFLSTLCDTRIDASMLPPATYTVTVSGEGGITQIPLSIVR